MNNNNKKNVNLAFMSGDQTWKRRIRLRTQATDSLLAYTYNASVTLESRYGKYVVNNVMIMHNYINIIPIMF